MSRKIYKFSKRINSKTLYLNHNKLSQQSSRCNFERKEERKWGIWWIKSLIMTTFGREIRIILEGILIFLRMSHTMKITNKAVRGKTLLIVISDLMWFGREKKRKLWNLSATIKLILDWTPSKQNAKRRNCS